MIPLGPRPPEPSPLTEGRPAAVEALRTALDANAKLPFARALYGHAQVKTALLAWQHDKCAFCESSIAASQPGDVEHFRPKGRVVLPGGAAVEPGYWWLAYTWSNLFCACANCNRSFKRCHFPLADEAARARSPDDDLLAERPLLLDPAIDAVEDHITFDRDVAKPLTDRGRVTIEVLGLNRDPLREARLDVANQLARLLAIPGAARTLATAFDAPRQPYLAMVRQRLAAHT